MSQNEHNAMPSEIGTLYQFYYFIQQCLRLRKGDVVGFERFDDVDLTTSEENGYYQLKHTTRKGTNGYKNMSPKDADFWKTIHVWIDFINNSVSNISEFINHSRFILVTNKRLDDNGLINDIKDFQNSRVEFSQILEKINNMITESEKKLQEKKEAYGDGKQPKEGDYVKWMREAKDFNQLGMLFKNTDFEERSIQDIQSEIHDILKNEKFVCASNVDNCFSELLGEMVKDWVAKGSEGGKYLSYTSESFCQRFHAIFGKFRLAKLNFIRTITTFDDNLKDSTFIHQLLDIDDIRPDDEDFIHDYIICMLDFRKNYSDFDKNHDITDADEQAFEKDVIRLWGEQHRQGRHKLPSEDEMAAARRVLGKVRDIRLQLRKEELDQYFSNGCFYSYSNIPLIGWLQNWKDLYKKDGQNI